MAIFCCPLSPLRVEPGKVFVTAHLGSVPTSRLCFTSPTKLLKLNHLFFFKNIAMGNVSHRYEMYGGYVNEGNVSSV